MKKITKKILAVIMVISVLLCSSFALSFSASAAKNNVIFTDYYGIEYRGQILYGAPGEEISLDPVIDGTYDYVCATSLDYYVAEDIWNDEGSEFLSLKAIENGVTLVNVWFVNGDEIVDDFYVLVVVSDGTDLGSVSDIEISDAVIGYDADAYLVPTIYYNTEAVYYCTFFDCQDYEAPFVLWSDGSCYGYEGGSGEAICYVIDAQGDVFAETFEIEVEEPSFFVRIIEFFSMIIDMILYFFA